MSLVVIYEGQRKVVKVPTPNTLVQALIEEAALYFQVDPNRAALQHRRTVLDKSQPFRFCGLSNNAQVDLVLSNTASNISSKPCKIALGVEGGENVTATFDSKLTLWEVVKALVDTSKLPSDALQRSPEVIYLRAKYSSKEELTNTTLTSLGLSGQSARLQLRFGSVSMQDVSLHPRQPRDPLRTEDVDETDQNHTSESHTSHAPITISTTSVSSAMDVEIGGDEGAGEGERDTKKEMSCNPLPQSHSPHIIDNHATQAPEYPYPPDSLTVDANQSISLFPISTSAHSPAASHSQPSDAQPTPQSHPSSHSLTPSECVKKILTDNFDAVSTPAVIVLAKYLMNLLLFPEDERFRRINVENKAFMAKVLPAKGASLFLQSVGFFPDNNTGSLLLPSDSDNKQGVCVAVSDKQMKVLGEGWDALQNAMTELCVRAQDRPAPASADAVALEEQRRLRLQQQQKQQQTAEASFDPYRSHIVRTAPQPTRPSGSNVAQESAASTALSATEVQLQELSRKRQEIEGNPADVDRCCEVVFPGQHSTSESLRSQDSDVNDESGNNTVPRSVLQKIMRRSGQEDEKPLTTQAVRDLQRAQRERVYSRTLIKIKFPDRVHLQGFFHPRHTIKDVYDWVTECLADPSRSFELYTSPPRTVLSPCNSSSSSSSGKGSVSSEGTGQKMISSADDCGPTLSDLKLVPAALVYLAWKNIGGGGGGGEGLGAETGFGQYLCPQLLTCSIAGEKAGADSSRSAAVPSYPTGHALAPQPPPTTVPAGGAGGGKSGIAGGECGVAPPKKSGKPKWLK